MALQSWGMKPAAFTQFEGVLVDDSSEEFRLLTQPQLSLPRVAPRVATAASRMLGTILIFHSDEDLIAQAIDIVRCCGALLAQSSTSLLDESSKRDVLVVDCTPMQWTRIDRELRQKLRGANVETSRFGAVSPATVIADVQNHAAASREITRGLARLGYDILLGSAVTRHGVGQAGQACVFNAIVSHRPGVLPWRLYECLTSIVRERGGKVLVADGCCQFHDPQETWNALVSPNFRPTAAPRCRGMRLSSQRPVSLARLILQMDRSQPGVLAKVLSVVSQFRGRILFPQGMVTCRGRGIVDVLFEVEAEMLSPIEKAVACFFPEMQLRVSEIDGSRLAVFAITARRHDGLTLEVVRHLKIYGLQIIQTSEAHVLSRTESSGGDIRVNRMLTAIVRFQRPEAVGEFTLALNQLAMERNGEATVNCARGGLTGVAGEP